MTESSATLYLIHGYLGAGKTTFARMLEAQTGAVRLSVDSWMIGLYGVRPEKGVIPEQEPKLQRLLMDLAAQLLTRKTDVILDFGFWSRAGRDAARAVALFAGAEIKLYVVQADEAVARDRVLRRSENLDGESYSLDNNAYERLKESFQSLDADEPHEVINTNPV